MQKRPGPDDLILQISRRSDVQDTSSAVLKIKYCLQDARRMVSYRYCANLQKVWARIRYCQLSADSLVMYIMKNLRISTGQTGDRSTCTQTFEYCCRCALSWDAP